MEIENRAAPPAPLLGVVGAPEPESPREASADEVVVFPASFAQQRLWFLDRLEPGSAAYNLYNAVRLSGRLRVEVLGRTLAEIVDRHETLRTTFATLGGEPVQVISATVEVRLPLVDLAALPEAVREAELARLSAAEGLTPFDLARGPLLRVTLVRLAAEDHAVLFNLHHIVGDGWSMGVLVGELAALYTAFAQGEPSPLPPLPLQYADFAQSQREWLQGEVLEEQLAYWRRQLAGLTPIELPADRPRPALRSSRGATRTLALPPTLAGAVADLARRRGTTLFTVLLAALQSLLRRYTGSDDVAVGTAVAGRSHVDTEGLIGFFVNTLVLRTGLSGALTFDEAVARSHAVVVEALAHQDLPFEKLVDELQPQRDLAHSPFFDVLLVFQNTPPRSLELPGLTLRPVAGGGGTAIFDWTLSAVETGGALWLSLDFSTDLFEAPTADRALRHLGNLLAAGSAGPDLRLLDLPLLGEAERAQLLAEWNDTAPPRPAAHPVHELFRAQAALTPGRTALEWNGGAWTYAELDGRACRLARRLRGLGVGPDVPVGVCAARGPELAVGLLAALGAGGAYLPLDPGYPRERLAFMLADARVPVVLVEERFAAALPEAPGTRVLELSLSHLEADAGPAGSEDSGEPPVHVDPDHLCYVIYTSGSTGRPKGVGLPHRTLANLVAWQTARDAGGAPARTLQLASPSFDVSLQEIFATWCTGGTLVVASEEARRDPAVLLRLLAGARIERLFLPYVALQQLAESWAEAGGADGLALREVITAGERLRVTPQIAALFSRLTGCVLCNHYGPSEAHVVTAAALAGDASAWPALPPIGRPIADTRAYVADCDLQPAPIGIPGEVLLGGAGLARGYLGRPDLTAERFMPDGFGGAPGARLYRTGDLARLRPDGAIDFLGRIDQQLKLRGFRVEPGEVEAALARHPAVRESAVVAREDRAGDARLMAYLVAQAGAAPTPPELRSFLLEELPDYMVPAAFVLLPEMPLTASGKIDRRRLPGPAGTAAAAAAGEPAAPRDLLEDGLAAIWREVLEVDRVGIHDVFFALGGHSLSATRVVSRLRAAFGVDLPLRALFEAPTVAGLAEKVRRELRPNPAAEALPLVADPAGRWRAPLSFAQQRLWFLDRFEPGSTVYNLRTAVEIRGDLDLPVFARSFGEVVRRHDALRTCFVEEGGEPVQAVAPQEPPAAFVLPEVDLVALGEAARTEARRLLDAAALQPFDLARDPLLRVLALRLPEGAGVRVRWLIVTLHHIVSDAWSMGILVGELSALYEAFRSGLASPLPELPVQYSDFARWQRRWLQGDILAAELVWWGERLAGLPARLELPADRARPPVQTMSGASREIWLRPELGTAVSGLALDAAATPFMVLLAAFQALLARLSGQEDFAVGTPVAGRTRVEIEGLIGFFINNLVLRADLAGDPGFRELVERVRATALDAYAHQDLPFEKLVEELAPERNLGHSPIFQVVFGLQTAPTGAARVLPGVTLDVLEVENRTAKYELLLSLTPAGAGFVVLAEYNTDLFDAATIERLLARYEALLAAVLADPGTRLSQLPLLLPAERRQILDWSGTHTAYPREATIQELFERQADRAPDAVAVVSPDGALTYGELDERANRLAHYLQALGVGPEILVGLCLERSVDLVVGLLGILKAGGAYVPFDPSYPLERLALLLESAFVPVLVAAEPVLDRLPAGGMTQIVLLDADRDRIDLFGAERSESGALADNLAYVMYTSGSTGEPKGVAVRHRGVVRLVRETSYVRFGPEEVFFQLAPVSFDASTFEIWGALLNGGRLAVPPPGTLSLAEISATLARHEVTTLWLTAGLFHEMVDGHLEGLAPVRQLLAGGDVLSAPHVRRVLAELPGRRLINGYGPTEGTTFTCCHPMVDPAEVEIPVSIGRPVANCRVYLLDRWGSPVPPGAAAELAIGGDGLARGYHDRPGLTAERWRPDAASGLSGERLYLTGDLAHFLPDGRLEFLGRVDHQVKVRGFRIEPGEIEAALARHPAVRDCVVIAREDTIGDRRLVAYVVAEEDLAGGDDRELRAFLGERLPAYMVPSHFVFLAALPLTPNGKVDRRALPAPGGGGRAGAGFLAPRDPLEEGLAAIWSEVLGRSPIGAQDNFFELGGHSLLAVRVISQVRDRFGVDLPLRILFEEPTVGSLAAWLRAGTAGQGVPAGAEAPPLRPLLRNLRPGHEDTFPLSFAQQRLWFLDRLDPGSATYNMPLVVRLKGDLNADVLERALAEIHCRHESLRTTFRLAGGEPVQVVAPLGGFVLPVVDLTALGAQAEDEVRRRVAAEARRPFDLERGPLFRPLLLRLAPGASGDHVVLASMHHIVSDAWSLAILVRELVALYRAFAAGAPSPLPELPVQYADYAVWQRRWLSGEPLAAELAWWREQLERLPALLELPTDRPRPAVQTYAGEARPIRVGEELATALQALALASGTTLFMVLLAAFQVLLARHAGQEDFAVGSPVAGRNRSEVEGLIGFFVNTLVLRSDLGGDISFRELLGRVRRRVLAVFAHQELPFEKLVEELRPERSLAHPPLFQVMLALQNAPQEAFELPGLRLGMVGWGETRTAKFDLTLSLAEAGGGLAGALEHNTDLFDAATIDRLAAHFERLLAAAADAPDAPVTGLPLLSEAERHQLAVEWNDTRVEDTPGLPFHLFSAWAVRTPEAPAVEFSGRSLSYGELDARSGRLAQRLRELGVGPEIPVGLFLERSADLLVGVFGAWKAGGAWVPLDPGQPDARLTLILEDVFRDVPAPAVVVHEELRERLAGLAIEGLQMVSLEAIEADGSPRQGPLPRPEDLAYVLYTSGTTGRPKGVMVEHGSLAHHLRAVLQTFDFRPGDRVPSVIPFTFDAFLLDVLPPLATGGTAVIFDTRPPLDLPGLAAELEAATHFNAVPALMRQAADELRRRGAVCHRLRWAFMGGDAVPTDLLASLLEVFSAARPTSVYGPTEATVISSWHTLGTSSYEAGRALLGRPLPDAVLELRDRGGRLVPTGVAGEVWLGGPGVARGYLHLPELTAGSFVVRHGQRFYRTGDLARRLPDGNVEFLGRIDEQVKVRGFRVEPGEIESVLAGHAAVAAAAVVVRRDVPGGAEGEPRLAACVVPRQPLHVVEPGRLEAELRKLLRVALPEYMMPADWALLPELPLTAHGKVDRRALAEVAQAAAAAAGEDLYVAPRTPTEELLAEIWGQLLGRNRVGVHDDFFARGGHSLLAVRVISRIGAAFGVDLPVVSLFEAPTVANLARRVEEALGRPEAPRLPPLLPAGPEERDLPAPLSFAQQRLWFLDRLEPGSTAYNLPLAVRIEGPLDGAALRRAFAEVVLRHEVLRTVLVSFDGEPVQEVRPATAFVLPEADLSALGRPAEEEASRLVGEDASRPFVLSRGPLFRPLLLRLGEADHLLLATMHHTVSDGWSLGVLLGELAALYEAFRRGRPSPLPEPPVQYTDFARWQRRWLTGDMLAAELAWWRERLAGLPALLELPADRPRPAVQSFRGARTPFQLGPAVSAAMASLARRQGATPFMVLLAAFQALLARHAGQENFAVGTPVAGRNRVELEGLIGFFANTLVLRADVSGEPAFRELLARVRRTTLDAFLHPDVPFERLVEELEPERSLSHSPVFQVMLAFQNLQPAAVELPDLRLRPVAADAGGAQFDLTLAVEEAGGEILGLLEYAADLFDRSTAARLLEHLRVLLAAAVERPEAGLSEIPLMAEPERQHLLCEWSDGGAAPVSEDCLHRSIERQADRTPAALAVRSDAERLTYGELEELANRMAHRLLALGVGPEVPVAVFMERSVEMLVALLGVLKAGGAYVPLDPAYPRERLAVMLGDCGAPVLVTQSWLADRLPIETGAVQVFLDVAWEDLQAESGERPAAPADPACAAYVVYTSGSTGVPKGVVVTHASAAALLGWAAEVFPAEDLEGVLAATSICFDLSVFELFLPLSRGGTVRLVENALDLLGLGAGERITLVNTVPSALGEVLGAARLPATVRTVNLAGEPIPAALVAQVYAQPGVERLLNLYGPTEDTTYSTFALVSREEAGSPPIGRPIAGTRAFVMDHALRPLPMGVPGELCLGGAGLARGYLRRPGLSAERFVPDPSGGLRGEPGARLYRTGDRARHLADGRLEFLGRLDAQVKLRGFRIEPGEVEAALLRHPAVREVAVAVRQDAAGIPSLVAWTVLTSGARPPSAAELRAFLLERLPEYMVPAVFVTLPSLPLGPTGKVDRRALPEFVREGRALPPRDLVELALLHVWEELLPVRPIGVRDNFFEIGGASLLAVRLMSRIRERFARELPLASLFRTGTIEQLAALLRREADTAPRQCLVEITPGWPGNGRRPLFFVHPAGGTVFCYVELAQALGFGRPFYGLQFREAEAGEGPSGLGEMAAHYVQAVREVQPAGPYRLGGWSLGGMVAFEMARQLAAAGEAVELLAMVDVPPPDRLAAREEDEVELMVAFARDLARLHGQEVEISAEELRQMPASERLPHLVGLAHQADLLPPGLDAAEAERLFETFRAVQGAAQGSTFLPYAGRAVLLVAESSQAESPEDPTLGWGRSAKGIEVVSLPGDHYSIVRSPGVIELARRLEERLAALEGDDG